MTKPFHQRYCLTHQEPDIIEHLRKVINLPENILSLDLHWKQGSILEAEVKFYPSPVINDDL